MGVRSEEWSVESGDKQTLRRGPSEAREYALAVAYAAKRLWRVKSEEWGEWRVGSGVLGVRREDEQTLRR